MYDLAAVLTLPPTPMSAEDAIAQGITLRAGGESFEWQLGWHAVAVTKQFGPATFLAYCRAIGVPISTMKRRRWVASIFSPDHVRQFPELPRTFFEIVAHIGAADIEEALSLLEDAAQTPDLTCEGFAQIVNPDSGLPAAPRLKAPGRLTSVPHGDGLLVGVLITHDVAFWREQLATSPLLGQMVDMTATVPRLPI